MNWWKGLVSYYLSFVHANAMSRSKQIVKSLHLGCGKKKTIKETLSYAGKKKVRFPIEIVDPPSVPARPALSIEISTAGFLEERGPLWRRPIMPLAPTYTYTSHQHLFPRCARVQRGERREKGGRSVVGGGVIASAQIEYISYVFITTAAPGPLSAPPLHHL